MSRVTDSDKLIPKIYRRKYDDIGLFFFVEGQRSIMPAVSITKAIENYYRYVCEDDYDLQCALTLHQRLKKEYYESAKTDR